MKKSINGQARGLEKRRLKAGRYFSGGKSQAWVARHFGVSTATTNAWHGAWKQGGLERLKSKGPRGVVPRLKAGQLKEMERMLLKGPKAFGYQTELWTLERVATLLRREMGVRYYSGHVWKILRKMRWSCQKPETRARERNERAIRAWSRDAWPRIQKKGSG